MSTAPRSEMVWPNSTGIASTSYTCGYCGNTMASRDGWVAQNPGNHTHLVSHIYICHFCRKPTYFDHNWKQYPGPAVGMSVSNIDDKSVEGIFEEARAALSAGCPTAVVMCCRKLLMHIAVSKGAPAGDTFAAYVGFLRDKGFVPPDAKEWVDHIRKKANEANHEIVLAKQEDAAELFEFCGVLLKMIFEFPATMKKRYGGPLAGVAVPTKA